MLHVCIYAVLFITSILPTWGICFLPYDEGETVYPQFMCRAVYRSVGQSTVRPMQRATGTRGLGGERCTLG